MRIDQSGLLKGFSTIERDGQSNLYVLRNITTGGVSSDLFKFSVPKGAELDDQRGGKKSKNNGEQAVVFLQNFVKI